MRRGGALELYRRSALLRGADVRRTRWLRSRRRQHHAGVMRALLQGAAAAAGGSGGVGVGAAAGAGREGARVSAGAGGRAWAWAWAQARARGGCVSANAGY